MIRVTITLIPAGVDDFAKEVSHLDISCVFPLDPANQNFYIFQGMKYAELIGYDGTKQPDDDTGWWNLVYDALTQLKMNGIERQGGEILPGMLAIKPVVFDQMMELLITNYGKWIKSIRLFGKRAENPELCSTMEFMKKTTKLARSNGKLTGGFLFDNWPEYQAYQLAVKLDPKLYQSGKMIDGVKVFANQGVVLEQAINLLSFRELPREENLLCNNGLYFFFVKPYPDKKIICYEDGKDYRQLKDQINSGNLIYDWREGLHKYPGKRIIQIDSQTKKSQIIKYGGQR
jgi:hypothetical protein